MKIKGVTGEILINPMLVCTKLAGTVGRAADREFCREVRTLLFATPRTCAGCISGWAATVRGICSLTSSYCRFHQGLVKFSSNILTVSTKRKINQTFLRNGSCNGCDGSLHSELSELRWQLIDPFLRCLSRTSSYVETLLVPWQPVAPATPTRFHAYAI